MSYIIIKSDGATLCTIQDGTINTTATSLGLPGRLYPSYGQVFDTNYVFLLENFANNTPPPRPLSGTSRDPACRRHRPEGDGRPGWTDLRVG